MPRNTKVKTFRVEISQTDTPCVTLLVDAENKPQVMRYLAAEAIRIEQATTSQIFEAGKAGAEICDATNC